LGGLLLREGREGEERDRAEERKGGRGREARGRDGRTGEERGGEKRGRAPMSLGHGAPMSESGPVHVTMFASPT